MGLSHFKNKIKCSCLDFLVFGIFPTPSTLPGRGSHLCWVVWRVMTDWFDEMPCIHGCVHVLGCSGRPVRPHHWPKIPLGYLQSSCTFILLPARSLTQHLSCFQLVGEQRASDNGVPKSWDWLSLAVILKGTQAFQKHYFSKLGWHGSICSSSLGQSRRTEGEPR